jgi:hypothetical protein
MLAVGVTTRGCARVIRRNVVAVQFVAPQCVVGAAGNIAAETFVVQATPYETMRAKA